MTRIMYYHANGFILPRISNDFNSVRKGMQRVSKECETPTVLAVVLFMRATSTGNSSEQSPSFRRASTSLKWTGETATGSMLMFNVIYRLNVRRAILCVASQTFGRADNLPVELDSCRSSTRPRETLSQLLISLWLVQAGRCEPATDMFPQSSMASDLGIYVSVY